MKRITLLIAAILAFCTASSAPRSGKVLPDWKQGKLDIHFINTKGGEGIFLIFPDGTSMVIDAGIVPLAEDKEIYSKYINHFLPATGSNIVDYAFLTHFHSDHFGDTKCSVSKENGYAHVGMTRLYDSIRYGKIVDRGYPTYGDDPDIYFSPVKKNGATSAGVVEWIKFVKYATTQGTGAERFRLGSLSQFPMCRGGEGRYAFSVTNLVANGSCLCPQQDGGTSVKSTPVNSENNASCGIEVKYGQFQFLTLGDLTGDAQDCFAHSWIASFSSPVELFKANHHLHHNAWGKGMTEVGFRPSVVIAESWAKTDPKHLTVDMMEKVSSLSDLYVTSPTKESLGEFAETYSKLKDYGGHFVVRVSRNGKYWIYKLNDALEVVAAHGPYYSK